VTVSFSNKVSSRLSLLFYHPKKGSFETIITQTLTTVRGMKITPLLHYPPITTWHNSYRLRMCNSGALPPVHELLKRPSYFHSNSVYIRTDRNVDQLD
jgi:hypothetical protein